MEKKKSNRRGKSDEFNCLQCGLQEGYGASNDPDRIRQISKVIRALTRKGIG